MMKETDFIFAEEEKTESPENELKPRYKLHGLELTKRIQEDIRKQKEKTQNEIKELNEKTKKTLKEQQKIIRLTASKLHKMIKFLVSKSFIYASMLLLQLVVIIGLFWILDPIIGSNVFLIISSCAGLVFSVYILNSKTPNEYKIVWILVIMVFTVMGIFLYLIMVRSKKGSRRKNKRNLERTIDIRENSKQDENLLAKAEAEDSFVRSVAGIIKAGCNLPLLLADEYEYFDIGEKYFERVKTELEKAEKFIFIESFIISEGQMWNELFEILKRKSTSGVDVRIIYDDFGTMSTIPAKFGRKCIDAGIKLYCFNRLRPVLDVGQNNRTHRKIIVIDGKCAFTGGLNIADEYINLKVRFGHWKDTGIMIKGSAVKSFSLMFLSSWMRYFGKEDITGFIQTHENNNQNTTFCIPFCDTPLNRRTVCADVYLKIISNAKNYIYIYTPYLILDDRMTAALISAVDSGVDVRIMIPHVPDMRTVFAMTRAFYTPLVLAGVKVYEYIPGFVHAKSIVADDKYCVIGSSNMDFRSLYLNYECNIFMYKGICNDIREDFEKTCEKCVIISREQVSKVSYIKRLGRSLLRIFAPMM